jgi:hypothetical protein
MAAAWPKADAVAVEGWPKADVLRLDGWPKTNVEVDG